MEAIKLKLPEACRWDCVSLGEVMLRLDPGEGRIHTSRTFQAWRAAASTTCRVAASRIRLRTAILTAFADNPIGRLVEDFILQGGVDTSQIKWLKYDGIGRTVRNGLNFTSAATVYAPRWAALTEAIRRSGTQGGRLRLRPDLWRVRHALAAYGRHLCSAV